MGPSSGAALSPQLQAEIQASIVASAFRIERLICVGRILFFSAILVRFAYIGPLQLDRILVELPLVFGVVFSAFVVLRLTEPPRNQAFWFATVTVDAVAAHVSLSSGALWPSPGHPGVLHLPEATGILLATVSTGLRLSPPVALWGGLLNLVGVLSLVTIDRIVSGPIVGTSAKSLSIQIIFVFAATMLATIFAVGTRRVVVSATSAVLRAERAERGLGTVLADCHDARSLLTSARLGAQLVDAAATSAAPGQAARLKLSSERLLQDLQQVERLILGVKSRALTELTTVESPSPVFLHAAAERVARRVRVRFHDVRLVLGPIPAELGVLVAGGEVALDRVLLNLLSNACEGDGARGATEVSLAVEVRSGIVELQVGDDGPGFDLQSSAGTTKPDGTGMGLRVVRGIVEGSGGRVFVRRRDGKPGTVVIAQLCAVGGCSDRDVGA